MDQITSLKRLLKYTIGQIIVGETARLDSQFKRMLPLMEMRYLTLLWLLLIPFWAWADFDRSFTFATRTFPLGLVSELEGGYKYKIWQGNGEHSHGYIRPALAVATAGTWNQAVARFEVAPISFLRLAVETQNERSSTENRNIDCQRLSCLALLRRQNAELTLDWAFGRVFGRLQGLSGTYGHNADQRHASTMVYYMAVLDNENFTATNFHIGYKFIDELNFLVHLSQASTASQQTAYQHAYGGIFYRHNSRSFYLALGRVESQLVGQNTSLLLRYTTEF